MFKFRLASVLRLREHIKDQKHWELRAMQDTRREMLAEIDALETELCEAAAVPTEEHILTVIELRLRAEHSQSLVKLIKGKRAALGKLDGKLAEKRIELVEAMRAVKSLEQLRQRQQDRYWRGQRAMDQKIGDEIAQRKFTQPETRKKIPSE
jgi:flagellar export protein FliJ